MRLDQRTCLFAGEVFTLPTDFEIAFCQAFDGLLAILGPLDLAGNAPMQTLQALFCFAEIARVGNRVAVTVGVEGFQAHINADLLTGRLMGQSSLCLDGKLHVVAIGTLHQSDALDLFERERFNGARPDQSERAHARAIGEGQTFAVRLQFPTRGFVLDTAIVFLEARVALLAWLFLAAVLVEPGDRLPGPVCRCLAGHRIKAGGKGEVFRQLGAERLHVILAHAARIHPEPNGFVPDELRGANGLVNRGSLAFVRSQFVLVDEHADPVCEQHPVSAVLSRLFGKSHRLLPAGRPVLWLHQLSENV